MERVYKTEICKFFLQQRCRNGSACAYAHSEQELQSIPSGCAYPGTEEEEAYAPTRTAKRRPNRTRLCAFFAAQGRCKYGHECRFAHSKEELPRAGSTENCVNDNSAGYSTTASSNNGLAPHSDEPSDPDYSTQERSEPDFEANYSEANQSEAQPSDFGAQDSDSSWESDSEASTKASVRDNVSTPAGSYFGGENADDERRRLGRRPTTVILKNVPAYLTQGALLSQFEDLSPCMRATFDFFYLPWNPRQARNLGYAIINFYNAMGAERFRHEWNDKDIVNGFGNERTLHIIPAILQGFEANLRHFSGFSLAHHANLRFRPLLRINPAEPLRAMAVAPEDVENFQKALENPHAGLPVLDM